MRTARIIAFAIAIVLVTTAGVLVALRGGLIAWGVLVLGALLLAKIALKPSARDAAAGACLAVAATLAWALTYGYVIATWETGEVVELEVHTAGGLHTARVWVFEIEGVPVVYYDAPPEVAGSLLAGRPVRMTRGTTTSHRLPRASAIDALPEGHAERILDAMTAKYGDRVGAADLFYGLLGRPRNRVALLVQLAEP